MVIKTKSYSSIGRQIRSNMWGLATDSFVGSVTPCFNTAAIIQACITVHIKIMAYMAN